MSTPAIGWLAALTAREQLRAERLKRRRTAPASQRQPETKRSRPVPTGHGIVSNRGMKNRFNGR